MKLSELTNYAIAGVDAVIRNLNLLESAAHYYGDEKEAWKYHKMCIEQIDKEQQIIDLSTKLLKGEILNEEY